MKMFKIKVKITKPMFRELEHMVSEGFNGRTSEEASSRILAEVLEKRARDRMTSKRKPLKSLLHSSNHVR